jgi:hypothetical protein
LGELAFGKLVADGTMAVSLFNLRSSRRIALASRKNTLESGSANILSAEIISSRAAPLSIALRRVWSWSITMCRPVREPLWLEFRGSVSCWMRARGLSFEATRPARLLTMGFSLFVRLKGVKIHGAEKNQPPGGNRARLCLAVLRKQQISDKAELVLKV